jgi:hypothetical protein
MFNTFVRAVGAGVASRYGSDQMMLFIAAPPPQADLIEPEPKRDAAPAPKVPPPKFFFSKWVISGISNLFCIYFKL